MLHIIWSIIIGFIVGLLARWFYPGAMHLGFWLTVLLGVAGSFVGGLIGSLFKKPVSGQIFHPAGIIMSILGSIIILFVVKQLGYM
ncbi:MAG: GlsB/YeaQ/YmgE family stress response membrane protein [Proteobacteria bacterium]|nr:GlsB/YeaQ/YmgE family stress response membrane protein [Pseudomonadota bacterium]